LSGICRQHSIKAGVDAVRLQPKETLAYNYAGFRDLAHLVGLSHIHITDNTINFAGDESGGQVSGYVQDDIRLSDRSQPIWVYVDRYDLLISATHVSPRLNLAFQVGGGAVSVHASYNHVFVPPPIEDVLSSAEEHTAPD